MAQRDPYEVLGVTREATSDEIKNAYRRLARKFHPDVNPNDPSAEDKFKEIGAAYEVLGDEEKRARFNRFGTSEAINDPFGGVSGGFGDLFDLFFGGGGSARRPAGRDGEDLQVEVHLTLLDVLKGATQKVKYSRAQRCEACGGLGTEGGKAPDQCPTCHGTGTVSRVQRTFIGEVRTSTPCSTCSGEGVVIRERCSKCQGRRLLRAEAEVEVHIPPGVDEGATMQIRGAGGHGLGAGSPGDLYIVLHIEDDPRFNRDGTSLITVAELTFAQAALGDKLLFDGLDGEVQLEVPPGTQPGTIFRIKHAGLPRLHGGARGDLLIQAQVHIPQKLSPQQETLIRQLAKELGEEIPEKGKSSLLKKLFRRGD